MKREGTRKVPERRKRKRSAPLTQGRSKPPRSAHEAVSARGDEDHCHTCTKDLSESDRALFVEEEVGRFFCSEECIATYFTPEIEKLEKEYFKRLSPHDLSASEREGLSHLRWITLQEADEVWREKTLTGDYRYTMISEFEPGNRQIWVVCICLFLRGDPSFLYLAFPSADASLVERYRKGERVQWEKASRPLSEGSEASSEAAMAQGAPAAPTDGLAEPWTEDETLRAQLRQERSGNDIPASDYSLYETCMNETLETPDEVWSLEVGSREGMTRLYHFIRHYPDEKPGVWYVVVARETEDEEQIEILDTFPTHDASLVDRYRRGEQEVSVGEVAAAASAASGRIVH